MLRASQAPELSKSSLQVGASTPHTHHPSLPKGAKAPEPQHLGPGRNPEPPDSLWSGEFQPSSPFRALSEGDRGHIVKNKG